MKNVLNFKSKSEVIEEDKKNRMFFHDLINQTHGILLFLNQKITYNKGASAEELELLNHEVKLLQTLLQDHFKYSHKNISANKDFVNFEAFETSLELLLKIYFPHQVKIAIEKRGYLALYESSETKSKAIIHYPSLYRIMNNLIKNMSEAETTEMYFCFDYNDQGLSIETKNLIPSKMDKKDVVDYLSRVILADETPKSQGLGLDSIHELVKSEGGEFNFEIQNGQWTNKIFLPKKNLKMNRQKIAA